MLVRLLLFVFLSALAQAQNLPREARFLPGDDPRYASPAWDDSDWDRLKLPGAWEGQGYPQLDGYAWLRIHFSVASEALPAEPWILAGNVDDADETFLNGVPIGSGGFGEQRVYRAPRRLFRNGDNVLAIRVRDDGGEGGLTGGILAILPQPAWEKLLGYGPAPKVSFRSLVTSNGMTCAVFSEEKNELTVWPHIYKMLDQQHEVKPRLQVSWNWTPLLGSRYVENTHVLELSYPQGKVQVAAPFLGEKRRLLLRFSGAHAHQVQLHVAGTASLQAHNSAGERTVCLGWGDGSARSGRANQRHPAGALSVAGPIDREVTWMRKFYTALPAELSGSRRALAEQSIAVLKMAQVAPEEGSERAGQIVASLPPGNWNICWMRDATYAILALNRLRMFSEARAGLDFFRHARVGKYVHFLHTDGLDHGVGRPYGITVCRYFGNGEEESDFNSFGPNIELDGFGLYLVAASDYLTRSADRAWLAANREWLNGQVADVILSLRAGNGLLRTDSGPWEMHLPGRQNAWTSVVSAAGLRDYGRVSGQSIYTEAAQGLSAAIRSELVRGGMLKGFAEAKEPSERDYYDGGTLEAFSLGVLDDAPLFARHMHEFSRVMRVSPARGFARLNQPGWYTWSEWPFLALRLSEAERRMRRDVGAAFQVDRIVHYARLNHYLIPELYGRQDEQYGGAIPMVGYGAGAYLLAVLP